MLRVCHSKRVHVSSWPLKTRWMPSLTGIAKKESSSKADLVRVSTCQRFDPVLSFCRVVELLLVQSVLCVVLTPLPERSSLVVRLVGQRKWSSLTLITQTLKNSFGAKPKKKRRLAFCVTLDLIWILMARIHSACNIRMPTTRCVSPTIS